jgi:hypothetical protein
MKKFIFAMLLVFTVALSACDCSGVKSSLQDWSKERSDYQARIYVKDSLLVTYKDSLKECQQDKRQLNFWKEAE